MKTHNAKFLLLPFILLFCLFRTEAQTGPAKAVLDTDGNGRTDLHVIARQAGPNGTTRTYWCSRGSGGGGGVPQIGCTDFGQGFFAGQITPLGADFENDPDQEYTIYKHDPANASYQSNFSAFGASPFNPILGIGFGLATDDPSVTADYSGDGKADMAVFRCNPNDPVGTQCFWIYRRSDIGTHVWIPWGTVYAPGKADKPLPGDYDGDGINDAAVRRPLDPNDPNSQNIVYIRRSSDGNFEYHSFGTSADKFVQGDFDGDRKTDLCVVRHTETEGAQLYWFIRYSSTGQQIWNIGFGLGRGGAVGDYLTPGDYTGDGRTDIAVWRRTAASETTLFYILPLTATPGVFGPVIYERFAACSPAPCEYPVNQYLVH